MLVCILSRKRSNEETGQKVMPPTLENTFILLLLVAGEITSVKTSNFETEVP